MEDLLSIQNLTEKEDLFDDLEKAFLAKNMVYIPDSNNSNYSGGFIRFEATNLLAHWIDYSRDSTFLRVPLVLSSPAPVAAQTGPPAVPAQPGFTGPLAGLVPGGQNVPNGIDVILFKTDTTLLFSAVVIKCDGKVI